MSGLLRRIKRSRPADAGASSTEGQAAAAEDAPTTADTPGEPSATPVLRADPSVPAGIDPAEAPLRPPAGRRGRLRRRLRYLRRARELMLRDLGGLLYEVHRTGGGDIEGHATVVGAKVKRIAGLDAEAHALETALAAPRAETIVFQPGIGGTCARCGEIYGSAARFCSNCGAATDAAPAAPAGPVMPAARGAEARTSELGTTRDRRRRRFWRRRKPSAPAATASSDTTSPPEPAGAGRAGDETAVLPPAGAADEAARPAAAEWGWTPTTGTDERATHAHDDTERSPANEHSQPAADERADAPATTPHERSQPATGDSATTPDERSQPATGDSATAPDGTSPPPANPGEPPRNPYAGLGNGRAEDHTPPDLSSGDPLISRELRS